MGAQYFIPTPERLEAVNFTTAVDEIPYALLIRRPEQEHRYLFLAPFTNDVRKQSFLASLRFSSFVVCCT